MRCGEDVKECNFYLDSTPTHSYLQALYQHPQAEFPYARGGLMRVSLQFRALLTLGKPNFITPRIDVIGG